MLTKESETSTSSLILQRKQHSGVNASIEHRKHY